jgi:UDP-glucose 4-epimerase
MIQGHRILITGGAGFIGSLLTERLSGANEVTIFDNLSRDSRALRGVSSGELAQVIRGDVVDPEAVNAVVAGHDVVIHCAAIAGIDTVGREPVTTMKVNVIGSFNVLAAASRLDNLHRVVCFSTSEIFGPNAMNSTETDFAVVGPAGEPRWTYAASKLTEEHIALAYHHQMGLPATVVRPFNVYGPAQVGEGAIRNFVERAVRDEPLIINGDGSHVRAWTYVDDMVAGVLDTLERDEAVGESFNIGNSNAVTTTIELARLVIDLAQSRSEMQFVPELGAEVYLRVPSTEKASRLLGFTAAVGLEEGVAKTIEWARSAERTAS